MSHTFATTIPADLKAQIDKHMELFRGFVMVDAGAGANDAEAPTTTRTRSPRAPTSRSAREA